MDEFEMDDFDLMCLHEHYGDYYYEYEDMGCDEAENQPPVQNVAQDATISMQFMPKGTGSITVNF